MFSKLDLSGHSEGNPTPTVPRHKTSFIPNHVASPIPYLAISQGGDPRD